MIKAFIFDLSGVLFISGTKKFKTYLSQQFHLLLEDIEDVLEGQLGTKYREGKLTREEFWEKALERFGLEENIDKLEEKWIEGFELIEETRDIILELSKKYKVYYLSDSTRDRINKINNKYQFLEWFENGVFSHEIGKRKPHPDLYKKVLEIANVKSQEALFIDDKESNLPPAKDLGMETILFVTPEDLKQELIQRGIII